MPTACKHCGELLSTSNCVYQRNMDHGNKITGVPYIKSDCRPCHLRLARVRNKLKKAHPAPPAGTPCTCCGAVRKLHLDHCHRTDRFRGWICSHCNTMLGLAGESREGLENGINYLVRSEPPHPTRSELLSRARVVAFSAAVWSDPDVPSRAVGYPISLGRVPISQLVRSDPQARDASSEEN